MEINEEQEIISTLNDVSTVTQSEVLPVDMSVMT